VISYENQSVDQKNLQGLPDRQKGRESLRNLQKKSQAQTKAGIKA